MNDLKNQAREAARLGVEYFLRNQNTDPRSADCGRYPYMVNCVKGEVQNWTTNWITGVVVSMMMNASRAFDEPRYLESATCGAGYLRSLQCLEPWIPECYGVLHEDTPQTMMAHPRDALTGAWALLDHACLTGNEHDRNRAVAYGDWFIRYAMQPGYPRWTVRFDGGPWDPDWHGSFHSGSAMFFYRLAQVTGEQKYADTMQKILDFYNANLLNEDGSITVIREHQTMTKLDECADPAWAPLGWIMMHRYNDDFGCLANLAAGDRTGETRFHEAALRFLRAMKRTQRADGGFGPAEWQDSIPNAAGVIVLEMLQAKRLGVGDAGEFDDAIERGVAYLIAQQYTNTASPFYGAFHGMTGDYRVDPDFCNARASGYAVMALLSYICDTLPAYAVLR